MDDETRDAQELTKDELLRMAEQGKRARVARRMPRRIQQAQKSDSENTQSRGVDIGAEWNPDSIIIRGALLEKPATERFPDAVGFPDEPGVRVEP